MHWWKASTVVPQLLFCPKLGEVATPEIVTSEEPAVKTIGAKTVKPSVIAPKFTDDGLNEGETIPPVPLTGTNTGKLSINLVTPIQQFTDTSRVDVH